MRDVYDICLTHSSTICKWFQNMNAEPGFTKEALTALKNKAKMSERTHVCSLVIDEMAV